MRACMVVALAALIGLAAATIDPVPHIVADKTFLSNQKQLLEFVWHFTQPLWDPTQKEIANSFKLEENAEHFVDAGFVKHFLDLYNHNFFKRRGESFTAYNKLDRWQAQVFVKLLVDAKDFDTFYKVLLWSRAHLNEGLVAYSFGVAKLSREDTRHLVLPPDYELVPQFFVKKEVMQQAYEGYLEGLATNKDKPYVVLANYSGYPYAHNTEELVSYFTEDVGLAAYISYMSLRYPYWAKAETLGGRENYKRRGDHFYFGLKQLLARYNLERTSRHLPDVDSLDYTRPIKVGPNEEIIPNKMLRDLASVYERRLYDAIDFGFLVDSNFTRYSLRDPESIELLGRVVEGCADSIYLDFYGSFIGSLFGVVSHGGHSTDLEHPATSVRHPLFYRIIKRVVNVFDHFKERLGPYPKDQLEFPGVKVESFTVDKLVTYFDNYDFELSAGLVIPNAEVGRQLNVIARTQRLTHKPFNYHIKVTSDKEVDAFVRVFYGPRYDVLGKELSLNEVRHKVVYLDSFVHKLKPGENVLERNSKSFNYYGNVPLSGTKLYQKTVEALNGHEEVFVDDFVHKYGDCERLALPRGTYKGLALRFYVIVKPFTHTTISKINPHTDDVGAHVSHFPFDRPIYDELISVPNAGFTEATVFYRNSAEDAAA